MQGESVTKCSWCVDGNLLEAYHDNEWGVPCHDDAALFEYLMLECMSCGLSWKLMLVKRDIFRTCFAGFDVKRVAAFVADDVDRILQTPGMIRSRRKVEAVVGNARCFIKIQQEYGSFDAYLWAFTGGKTLVYKRHLEGQWLTRNELSDRVAADLRARGFKFLGSTLVYSFLQGVGLVNDHDVSCPQFALLGGDVVDA